ncbi:unnamed protein product [Gongylonema pulchrum]|uniref:Uncharacterized protein n=1 Tax=Gongylonema pulchrum TaxID=637853 RepID=A0A183EX48_9BILA|nr:unnamed protein product [Gongylonema pulchrum]
MSCFGTVDCQTVQSELARNCRSEREVYWELARRHRLALDDDTHRISVDTAIMFDAEKFTGSRNLQLLQQNSFILSS